MRFSELALRDQTWRDKVRAEANHVVAKLDELEAMPGDERGESGEQIIPANGALPERVAVVQSNGPSPTASATVIELHRALGRIGLMQN